MIDIQSTACCGIKEIDEIMDGGSPRSILRQVGEEFFAWEFKLNKTLLSHLQDANWDYAYDDTLAENYPNNDNRDASFLFFSEPQTQKGNTPHGSRLARYIKKNRLGDVWESPPRINPNSHNVLCMWVWVVDIYKFAQWYNKNA